MNAQEKFGEHKAAGRHARGGAESNCRPQMLIKVPITPKTFFGADMSLCLAEQISAKNFDLVKTGFFYEF